MTKQTLQVDEERLWRHLIEHAQIGATPDGGVNRVALTDTDKSGREKFIEWCKEEECTISIDQMGNIFARRKGTDNSLPAIMIGSHLDTQPTGGKFDGIYGVLAGLEVIRTLNKHNIETRHPIEIVSWTNEEGARFAPAMISSGVFAGVFELDYAYSRIDKNGVRFDEELQRIGFKGSEPVGMRKFKATFELHIEQGAILEQEKKTIGIVTGVQGIRWYDLVIKGKETHAGPNPMSLRKDPLKAALPLLDEIYKLADKFGKDSRVTIGNIDASPGIRNTVAGKISCTIDLRHPDENTLEQMHTDILKITQKHNNQDDDIKVETTSVWNSPPVYFNHDCIDAVEKAVDKCEVSSMKMVSGAGHDSVYISKVVPTSMIFIPCKDGISHNPAESIEKKHAAEGANVLLNAILITDKIDLT